MRNDAGVEWDYCVGLGVGRFGGSIRQMLLFEDGLEGEAKTKGGKQPNEPALPFAQRPSRAGESAYRPEPVKCTKYEIRSTADVKTLAIFYLACS